MAPGQQRFEVLNSKQVILLVVPPIFFALATAAVAARWYARKLKRINTLVEDAFCLAGLIMSFLVVTIIYIMVFLSGEGLTAKDIKKDPTKDFDLVHRYWSRTQFAVDICWATSVTAVQLSFLKFYVRLYDTRLLLRRLCYVLMALISIWYVWSMVMWIVHCHPPGKCELPSKTTCIVIGSLHVFFNAAILFVPVPAVLDAQLSTKRQLTMIGLILLGCFCTICAVLRIDCALPFFGDFYVDPIAASWGRVFFSPLEIAVGIICCSIPNLTPLNRWRHERRHLPKEGTGLRRLKFRSSSHSSSTSNLNPANWMPGTATGKVNAFVTLEDGGKSDERVRELGPHEIKVTREYNVGHRT